MTKTRVIHVSEMKDNLDAVYIGRGMPRQSLRHSPWANPFKIGRDGTRAEVVAKYYVYVIDNLSLLDRIEELRGKPLACWCRRDGEERTAENLCHGDVLIELLGESDA